MTYHVFLTAKAQRQLEEMARWWAVNRSVDQAQRWYDGFVAALRSLKTDPERCPFAREKDSFSIPIRELRYGLRRKKTHRAVFVVRTDSVVVYAVRHLAQQDLTPDDL